MPVTYSSEAAVNDDLRRGCNTSWLPEGADVVFSEADLEAFVGIEGLKPLRVY